MGERVEVMIKNNIKESKIVFMTKSIIIIIYARSYAVFRRGLSSPRFLSNYLIFGR